MAEIPEPSYTEALVEARRGFDQLAGEVEAIRGRAVALLGAGGLAAAFIGGLSIRDGAAVSGWTWTAVGAFGAMAVLAVVVLLPRRFHVSQDPATIVVWAEQHSASKDKIERDLAPLARSEVRGEPAEDRSSWQDVRDGSRVVPD